VEKAFLVYLNLPRYFMLNNLGGIYAASSLDFLPLIKKFDYRVKVVIAG